MRGEVIINPVTRIGGNMEIAVRWEQGVVSQVLISGLCGRDMAGKMVGRTWEKAGVLSSRFCGECGFSHYLANRNAVRQIQGCPTDLQGLEELVLAVHMIVGHLKNFYFSILPDYGVFSSSVFPLETEKGEQMDCRLEQDILSRMERTREELWKGLGKISRAVSALTGKWIHGQLTEGSRLDSSKIMELKKAFILLKEWSKTAQQDADILANIYQDYFYIGAGNTDFIDFGCFPKCYCQGGWRNPLRRGEIHPEQITLDFSHSWKDERGNINFSKQGGYSQLFSAGYQQMTYEMGAVARKNLCSKQTEGSSVMGRITAVTEEASLLCQQLENLLEQAKQPLKLSKAERISGRGLGIAPCCGGSILHLVEMQEGLITKYAVLSPCHWNLAPQTSQGTPSPIQTAVLGTQFPDKETGMTAVKRILHSFTPCLYCGG